MHLALVYGISKAKMIHVRERHGHHLSDVHLQKKHIIDKYIFYIVRVHIKIDCLSLCCKEVIQRTNVKITGKNMEQALYHISGTVKNKNE